ncbi:MAG TPA: murein biosynthesis integral membrane protein MurJ [Verrucomicrobiae bacterium]|nr:murein biosynthesis integral membrane protein MurJ [Verrucomicrobiae bacterium]
MLKASGAMAAATLLSRVLGMAREMVYARFMGDGWVASAFTFAFQIPNLFRRLLGEGALTAAFIPIFKEKEKLHGEIEMWRAANAVISGLVVTAAVVIAAAMLGISVALAIWGTPHIIQNTWDPHGLPHFTSADGVLHYGTPAYFSEKTILMLRLLREMFPYMLLVCLAAAFMGMLNARGHFFIPAMGATALNVVMIASVLWLAPRFGRELPEQIFALAVGVLAAGVAQAAFQLPTLWRDGFRYRWVSPWKNETVRVVVRRMIPGTIGLAAFQINVLLTQTIAFWVSPHIVASFNYAVRLMELPQGMFGISLATFLLPALAGLAAEKNYSEFRATLRHGLSTLFFANLIAAILLVVLAEPIVRLLFERGEFTIASTRRATLALMCLAPGLVAFSSVNILARAFYALGDTRTPMKISIGCLVLNLVLAAALIVPLQQGGIGLANTVTSTCNAALLLFALRRKLDRLEMKSLCEMAPKLLLITAVAGLIAWQGWRLWENSLGHATLPLKIGAVFVPAGIAGSVYLLAALWFEIPAAKEIVELTLAKFRKNKQK